MRILLESFIVEQFVVPLAMAGKTTRVERVPPAEKPRKPAHKRLALRRRAAAVIS
jgi:hypothetical protein